MRFAHFYEKSIILFFAIFLIFRFFLKNL